MIRPVSHRHFLRRAAVAAAAAAALVCTACSGSENPGSPFPAVSVPAAASSAAASSATLDASKVGDTITETVRNASSVRISGTQVSGDGSKTKLDLQIGKTGVTGSIEKDGIKIPLLRVGEKVYFQFTQELAKASGVPDSAAPIVVGKWVPLDSKAGKSVGDTLRIFLNYDLFMGAMASELSKGAYTGGEPADVSGIPALSYQNSDGKLYLEAAAPHRLLRADGGKDGSLDFSDWDKPVDAKVPADSEIFTGAGA